MIDVLTPLSFITLTRRKKILASLQKDIQEVGRLLKRNSINVLCFAQIATVNCTQKLAALSGNAEVKSE
jgi:hypothetical protein